VRCLHGFPSCAPPANQLAAGAPCAHGPVQSHSTVGPLHQAGQCAQVLWQCGRGGALELAAEWPIHLRLITPRGRLALAPRTLCGFMLDLM
jgi:hypothetical protein